MLGRGIDSVPADHKEIKGTRICVKIAVFFFLQEDLGGPTLVSDDNCGERALRLDEEIRRVASMGQKEIGVGV